MRFSPRSSGRKDAPAAGSLKIFFGMAAGVGKTYAMLREAAQRRDAGTFVLLGLIDSHGRRETGELTVVSRPFPSRSTSIAASGCASSMRTYPLAPASLVLVDELAHTKRSRLEERETLAGRHRFSSTPG